MLVLAFWEWQIPVLAVPRVEGSSALSDQGAIHAWYSDATDSIPQRAGVDFASVAGEYWSYHKSTLNRVVQETVGPLSDKPENVE